MEIDIERKDNGTIFRYLGRPYKLVITEFADLELRKL
jgi:hypothetical protein